MEIWKDIKGYEGFYQVSILGRIKSLRRNLIMKPQKHTEGYSIIKLSKKGEIKIKYIHILVAEHFLIKDDENLVVNHKDGNKSNNSFSNLEWVTQSENIAHSFENGLKRKKINESDREFIKNNFKSRDKEFGATGLAKRFNITPRHIYFILGNH